MKYDPLPITPEVVKWARARAGFSLDEAKEILSNIDKWESGIESPTYPQLETMSDKFKVPIAVFFFPQPPNVPHISESFRTLPEQEFERLPPRIQYLVRKAKVFQLNLAELEPNGNPAKRQIVKDLSGQSQSQFTALAQAVRNYIGVSIEEQISWTSTEDALTKWRAALLAVGVYVFKDQFKHPGYSGFCLYDREFPLVYVNNSCAKSRQIFTLFHELAHLLFETSGIDPTADDFAERYSPRGKQIEVECNQFAAEFLLPAKIFENAVAGLSPSEETATRIASKFHISRESVFRRFLDRRWISKAAYDSAAKRWNEERGTGSGGNYYNTKFAYLGREYIGTVFSQYYTNKIDETQAAEFLDVKPKALSGLEARLLQSAA